MSSIICLGTKACDVGECFEIFSDTQIIKLIDIDIEGDNCYSLKRQKSAEEYEKNTPDLSDFFHDISDDVLFIVSGESDAANCSLKILQQIKHKEIRIIYISPQREFLTAKQIMQERVVRNVLQEYTRSGVFKEVILLDASAVENIMQETSIKDFDNQYNQTIVTLIRSYNSLEDGEKIIDQSSTPNELARILTFGYYDTESDSERSVYGLSLVSDKIYHFFLSEETLEGDSKFLKELKTKIKNKVIDNTRVSYTIRNTNNKTDFCFVVYYSKATQQ